MQDFIKINKDDNVAVALKPIAKGTTLNVAGIDVTTVEDIPQGHKFVIKAIKNGDPVITQFSEKHSSLDKSRELKILVAEDNDSNYLLVRQILKGYHVVRALNGVEAVKMSRDEKFDLIFMDMKMPVMGGLEATRKIREFDAEIPIIALTANAFDSDRISAMDAGCNAFLAKPLERKQLLEIFSMKW